MQTRDQELSFGTKIYDILFDIDEDISPRRKKRKVIWATLYVSVLFTHSILILENKIVEKNLWA